MKALKKLLIFIIILAWFLSGWPQIWQKPPIPPKIEQVQAQTTIDVLPNAKHANDTTGDTLSGITGDDSTTENPDTLSSVDTGDNVYTADKNDVIQFDTFDVSSIPDGSAISAAVLHLQYGAEDGYNGSNSVRYDNGGGLTTTGITPTDITGWSSDLTFDLYGAGVDTKTKIQNVDIEFTSNDGAGPDAIHFDYTWITVTYTPPVVSVTITPGGTIAYGNVEGGQSKSTIDLTDTQTAQNDGSATENFNIMTSNAINGTSWTIGSSAGNNVFVHEFSTNSGGDWTKFTAADSYQTLATGVEVSGTVDFDLRITVPTDSDSTQKNITITVQAVAP